MKLNVNQVRNALPKSRQEIIRILSPDRSPERPTEAQCLQRKENNHQLHADCNKCRVEAALSLSSFGSSDELQDEVGDLDNNLREIDEI